MERFRILVLVSAALVVGCSTGFDRGALEERLAGEKLQVTDSEIEWVRALEPQLRFPFKLGIFLDNADERYARYSTGRSVRWRVEDKESVLAATASLVDRGVVADAFFVDDMTTSGRTLREVRLAAARHGADAVLVVRSMAQVDSYLNPLCLLNLLIIPGWIVPSSHRDALLVVRGALWDVGNGYLYATAEAEGTGGVMRATFNIEDEQAVDLAKKEALARFAEEIVGRVGNLKGSVQPSGAAPAPGPDPEAGSAEPTAGGGGESPSGTVR